MIDYARIAALLDQRPPGHSLPQGLYAEANSFAFDLEAIHWRSWLLIGFEVELPRPGSHLALDIGPAPEALVEQAAALLRPVAPD